MLAIGKNLARFAESRDGTTIPVTDCSVNAFAGQTTTIQSQVGAAARNVGRATSTGTDYRRKFYILDVTSDPGRVKNFRLRLNQEVAAAGGNFVLMAVDQQVDLITDNGMSWANVIQSGTPTAWAVAPTETTGAGSNPGHNVNTAARVVFAMPTTTGQFTLTDELGSGLTNPASGSLDDVVNLAKLHAIENGWTKAVLLAFSENEANTTANLCRFSIAEAANQANRPSVTGFILYRSPLDGWLMECPPCLALPSISAIDIGVQVGTADLSISANADVIINHGLSGVLGSSTTPADVSALVAGEKEWALLTGLSNVEYYNVEFDVGGITYATPEFRAPLFVAAGTPFRAGRKSDDHKIVGINQVVSAWEESLQVQEAADERIATYTDAADFLRYFIHDGDGPEYALEGLAQMFPIHADGTLRSNSPNSYIVTSAAEGKEIVRGWLVQGSFPCESVAMLCVIGNHAAYSADFATERDYMLAALRYHRMIPHTEDYRGYDAPAYDTQTIGDFAFACGDKQIVCLNVGYDVDRASAPGNNTSVDSVDDWVIDAARLTWLTGIIENATSEFFELNMHHTLGGGERGDAPGTGIYGRSDERDVETGYYGVNIAPLLRLYYYGKCFVRFGHDHIHNDFVIDGIQYVYHASPGVTNFALGAGGPFSINGFGSSGPNDLHQTSGNILGNAGIYIDTTSEHFSRIAYINVRIHTSPTDLFETGTNDDFADGETLRSIYIGAETSIAISDSSTTGIQNIAFTAVDSGEGVELIPAVAGSRNVVLSGNVVADSATEFELLSNDTIKDYELAGSSFEDETHPPDPTHHVVCEVNEPLKIKCNGIVKGSFKFARM